MSRSLLYPVLRLRRHTLLLLAVACCTRDAFAQSARAVAGTDTTPARGPGTALTPEFSGVLFANYQYGGLKGNRSQNRFELERSYLTIRAPAGDRVNVRVTADVFQQRDTTRDAYYRGWTMRVKYAYAQYEALRGTPEKLRIGVRFGILQTPIVDFVEQHWNRGVASAALDAESFFNSADAGAAVSVMLPHSWGEIYAASGMEPVTPRGRRTGSRMPEAASRSPRSHIGARSFEPSRFHRGSTLALAPATTRANVG